MYTPVPTNKMVVVKMDTRQPQQPDMLDIEKEELFELCDEAKVAFKKRGVVMTHLYYTPLIALLSILGSNDMQYLVDYYADSSNSSALLEAFFYPVAILMFAILMILVYVMYTGCESIILNTLCWLLEYFLVITVSNFIIQLFQTWLTPGTGQYLMWSWLATIFIAVITGIVWLALELHQRRHIAKVQLRYIATITGMDMDPTKADTQVIVERVNTACLQYQQKKKSHYNMENLLNFPIARDDSVLGVLSNYQDLVQEQREEALKATKKKNRKHYQNKYKRGQG